MDVIRRKMGILCALACMQCKQQLQRGILVTKLVYGDRAEDVSSID